MDVDEEMMEVDDLEDDPDYEPEEEDEEFYECEDEEEEESREELKSEGNGLKERKFLVFESCLSVLFTICTLCLQPCKAYITATKGSCIKIVQICSKGHKKEWRSQPLHNGLPLGNLSIAQGLLFAGASQMKTLLAMTHSNIKTISIRTYHQIQRYYLVPAITRVWDRYQVNALTELQLTSESLDLGGDARFDSRGYSAKYGSYTCSNLKTGKVLDVQLVQCNEVTSSVAMELEGLKRVITHLEEYKVNIRSLTTDRHSSVKKHLRTEKAHIKHWFDVWHMAKKIYMKVCELGKKTGHAVVLEWAHSISNHLYWCAASSNGDAELVKEKWLSILNHICNVHHGHGEKYTECQHGDLDRKWLEKGGRTHAHLREIITNKAMLSDVGNLSPGAQTSKIESFHKIVGYFAPKEVHYFYEQMEARTLLAALHFNENTDREQSFTKTGTAQWRVSYPKYKKGGAVVKEVKIPATFQYVQDLTDEVEMLRNIYPSYKQAKVLVNQSKPAAVSTKFDKQEKASLVDRQLSRFNKVQEIIWE